jgi:hypothetical protein
VALIPAGRLSTRIAVTACPPKFVAGRKARGRDDDYRITIDNVEGELDIPMLKDSRIKIVDGKQTSCCLILGNFPRRIIMFFGNTLT